MKIRRKQKENGFDINPDELVIIDDIQSLNEKYIKLFIDLKTHLSIIDENFYLAAKQAVTEQYVAELALARAQARHLTEEKFYLANRRTSALGIYSFRKWFKKHDSPMKQILDELIAREAEGYISALYEGLEPPPEEPEEVEEKSERQETEAEDPLSIKNGPVEAQYIEDEEFDEDPDEDVLDELYELEEADIEAQEDETDNSSESGSETVKNDESGTDEQEGEG